ncbi:hypothetical protein QZQ97_19410 [Serratia sp. root2]|nr:hypothetical protein [Serratia sp. root2]MDT3253092.1 hypothetical protein [Serratia sp. root2]
MNTQQHLEIDFCLKCPFSASEKAKWYVSVPAFAQRHAGHRPRHLARQAQRFGRNAARNGRPYRHRYVYVLRMQGGKATEVHALLDLAPDDDILQPND